MGLYRKISCAYWQGELAETLRGDAVGHTVAFYLMTCPSTNPIGCYQLALPTLADGVGYASETCLEALSKLSETGFSVFDERFRMVFITEFARHEWGESPNPKRNEVLGLKNSLPHYMDVCRKSFVWQHFWDRYEEPWKEILDQVERPTDRRVSDASRTRLGRMPNQDQDQDQDQERDQEEEDSSELPEDEDSEPPASLGPPVGWIPYTGPDPKSREHRELEGPEELGRRELAIYQSDVSTWADAYPGVDVVAELKKARSWSLGKKKNRKTANGMRAFLNTWMNRAQNGSRGGAPQASARVQTDDVTRRRRDEAAAAARKRWQDEQA